MVQGFQCVPENLVGRLGTQRAEQPDQMQFIALRYLLGGETAHTSKVPTSKHRQVSKGKTTQRVVRNDDVKEGAHGLKYKEGQRDTGETRDVDVKEGKAWRKCHMTQGQTEPRNK